ncbi:MAG: hypothetical protein ACYS29_13945, partial [Planctomycetota bacterium]
YAMDHAQAAKSPLEHGPSHTSILLIREQVIIEPTPRHGRVPAGSKAAFGTCKRDPTRGRKSISILKIGGGDNVVAPAQE